MFFSLVAWHITIVLLRFSLNANFTEKKKLLFRTKAIAFNKNHILLEFNLCYIFQLRNCLQGFIVNREDEEKKRTYGFT